MSRAPSHRTTAAAPAFDLQNPCAALTIGVLLKFITFPLTVITLGIFWFVINALMLKLTAAFVPGFRIHGFLPAFLGAIVFSVVNMVLRLLVP